MNWRPLCERDRADYTEMATAFYASEAVDHPIPVSHIEETFEELMRSDVYAVGYLCEYDGETAGYALCAKTFSQEAGGMVLWVEELYVKDAFRGRGIGKRFLSDMTALCPSQYARIRLETEKDNHRAVRLYESLGFTFLAYDQMIFGQ